MIERACPQLTRYVISCHYLCRMGSALGGLVRLAGDLEDLLRLIVCIECRGDTHEIAVLARSTRKRSAQSGLGPSHKNSLFQRGFLADTLSKRLAPGLTLGSVPAPSAPGSFGCLHGHLVHAPQRTTSAAMCERTHRG